MSGVSRWVRLSVAVLVTFSTGAALADNSLSDWIKSVRSDFEQVNRRDKAEVRKLLESKEWDCTFYGVQKPGILTQTKVYRFKADEKGEQLTNDGRQIVKSYTVSDTGAIGNIGPLHDELRITKAGKLVGLMAKDSSSAEGTKLAWTSCK